VPVGVETDDPGGHSVQELFGVSRLATGALFHRRRASITAYLSGL
jgi:hypothetical protein